MDTARLRQATQEEHAATEATVPLMRPTLDRAQYIEVLRGFYRIVRAWDVWAQQHAPADLQALLEDRRQASLLAADLQAMEAGGVPGEDEVLHKAMVQTAVQGDPRSVFLGRMYVMEGSTLGGQLLARHVEEHLGLTPGHGNSYFRGYGEHTGERWREFKAVLQSLQEVEADTVIASAKNMFQLFGQAMTVTEKR